MTNLQKWKQDLSELLKDLTNQAELNEGDLLVVGCSTSEVIGEKSVRPAQKK